MWVCFNDAFISIVEDQRNPALFKVRARNKAHLETLFPGEAIIATKDSDYRHRVIVGRAKVAALLVDRIGKIDYGNFKNSVKDRDLHDLYASFWNLHYNYQYDIENPWKDKQVHLDVPKTKPGPKPGFKRSVPAVKKGKR